MKKIILLIFLSSLLSSLIGQDLTLIKNKRSKTLNNKFYNFFLESKADSGHFHYENIKGEIQLTHDDHILVSPTYRIIKNTDTNCVYTEFEWYYPENQQPIKIFKDDIYSLNAQSKSQDGWEIFSYILMGTGVITTSIVAPLASINYGKLEINSKRYKNIAFSGLVMIGISIPITLMSKPKWYCIKQSGTNNSRCWKIK